ncbi:MAG: DUF456 family protein [Deltaproteobacteria bacterium]|jgi:uncharacterized protein YqgC (DUF456 family)|nr:DUF456 family protein [Deltaproteobacteria bacterium]
MGAIDIIVFTLAVILMLAGAAGAFIPVIPGLPLNWLVLLGYGFWSGWGPYGFWTMLLTGLAAAAGLVCDQLAGAMGARKFGASKAGMIGSFVGALLGLIVLNIPGLILGTFLGAMLAEIWFQKKEMKAAADSGLGALLGCFAGGMFKFIVSLIMTAAFVWLVLSHDPPSRAEPPAGSQPATATSAETPSREPHPDGASSGGPPSANASSGKAKTAEDPAGEANPAEDPSGEANPAAGPSGEANPAAGPSGEANPAAGPSK